MIGILRFVDAVLAGEGDLDAICDHVEAWHQGRGEVPLWGFLGMTRYEYARWVERAEVLPLIVLAHRFGLPLTEREEIEQAARASGLLERAILDDWLSRTAIPA